MEWPTTRPLTRWSRMVRFYWWLICLLPPVTLLAALDTARTARSADEALGLAFFTAPFLLTAFALGPFLAYRGLISSAITRGERAILVVLGAASVPLFFLVSAVAYYFGGWPRGIGPMGRYVTLALTASWVLLAVAARRKLHRDIPARWHQLWWLLVPLPPVSFFLAVANLFPPKPTDQAPYRLWPFLLGAIALTPVLVYRALFSPTATQGQRVTILVASLTVLPLFLFFCAAWQIGDAWPKDAGPGRWFLFLAWTAGWLALAVATRLKLRDQRDIH